MIMNPTCYVCNDIRKYKVLVEQTRNITHQLKNLCLKKEYNENDKDLEELKHSLKQISLHCNFMCGHCSKINETDLKMVEKEMNTIIIQIASEVNEKNSTYFQTLQLLRGTYSYKYNCFERYCMKKFRSVKNNKKGEIL